MARIVVDEALQERLQNLEKHLEQENPVLLDSVKMFRELDSIGYRTGLLAPDESYATQVPWWPLIAIMGTFSAGKSTFINDYTGKPLQKSGNQAVDDKFTVMCFGRGEEGRVLPGIALDADMRFPFFKISDEIERVAEGEGRRIDAYLQLKTTSSESVRGKILIDSPGFDSDAQRRSTLKITNHIIDLSDLVLVFFDARHPEPGAMQDTLNHLVANTINRADSNKFMYILNQLDTAAREDNPEEIVAAWQRGLAQAGLTAGRFYTIYSDSAATTIQDDALRARFESKRDADLAEIKARMHSVEIERAYRIVGALENQAHTIGGKDIPALQVLIRKWRQSVLVWDGVGLGVIFLVLIGLGVSGIFNPLMLLGSLESSIATGVVGLLVLLAYHFWARAKVASRMIDQLEDDEDQRRFTTALKRNTKFWRSIFLTNPSGWSSGARNSIKSVLKRSTNFIQRLNDQFTDPSGKDD